MFQKERVGKLWDWCDATEERVGLVWLGLGNSGPVRSG